MTAPDPRLRLSAQRALLGAVGGEVLGVCVALHETRLAFTGFVSPAAGDDEREALDFASSEMLADFPEVMDLDLEIEPISGTSLPARPGHWVFLRLGVGIAAEAP